MSADRPGLDKRIVRGFLGGAAAGIMASAAVISAPSVEASSLAAMQPGLTTSFAPEKSSVRALGCAPAFGIRIPTALTGEFVGQINAEVDMKVGLVENGVVTKDVTDRLSSGEVNFNLINLKGEVLRVINKTPKVKVDYGFSDSPDGDAYKSPIGRASFNEGQLRAHLNEIRRFDRADGGHSWDEVSDFIKIVSKTAEGLKTYKDECGTETERRYARAFPRYLYNGQQLSAGGFVEVAEGCKTDVIFTSMHYVEAPKPTEPQPDRTPVPVIPAPVQAPVQAPPKPAPAQLPGEVR